MTAEEQRLLDALNSGRTIVVNVRGRSGPHARLVWWLRSHQLITYVGHAGLYHNWPESPFANPFHRKASRDRENCIARYEAWLTQRPELLRRINAGELTTRALGCWCAPLRCHADVLARIAERVRP